MRLPNEQERDELRRMMVYAQGYRGGEAAKRWLADFLDIVDACEDWPVDLEREGCAACLGEHPFDDGREIRSVCAIAEQLGNRIPITTDEQRAPDWCPLRQQSDGPAATFLVRGT